MSNFARFALVIAAAGAACAPSRAIVEGSPVTFPPDAGTAAAIEPLEARIGPTPELRLPQGIRPTAYRATLEIDAAKDSFSGELEIDLAASAPTRVVWLNATELDVGTAELVLGAQRVHATAVKRGEDFVAIVPDSELAAGPATLKLSYRAKIDKERSRGVYAAQEGADWYAYTFFEPIDGRRAFPCFDEPSFKVPWTLTLRVPRGHRAFANSPQTDERADGDWTVFHFAPTRPIPSYLVAFGTGPFDVVDAGAGGAKRIPVRIVVPKGRGADARYAQEVTARIVSLLEDFLGVPYPYEKLDVLAVPRFWGTMEHPGLVALGQPLTLIPKAQETTSRQQDYANTAIHELGHYWFGDLVTMAWWDDTWLNEALTSWLDIEVTDRFAPEWKWKMNQTASNAAFAMQTDALRSAQPLRLPIETREDILGSFENSVTYAKGASVLAMVAGYAGEERFRAALRGYLERHAWGNASAGDFLASIGESLGPDARAVFESYLDQPGHPIVTGNVTCGKAPSVHLSQERFVASGPTTDQRWVVPICLRADGLAGERCVLLRDKELDVALEARSCPTWLVLNAGGRGYYRVRDDFEHLQRLILRTPQATVPERLAAISTLLALSKRGDVDVSSAIALITPLSKDPAPRMLDASLELTRLVRTPALSDDTRARWERLLERTYAAKAKELGWTAGPGEASTVMATRIRMLSVVGYIPGDQAVAPEAQRRAAAWLTDHSALHPDLVMVALPLAAKHGDRALFDRLLAAARAEKDRAERARLLDALGKFLDPALSSEALKLVLSSEFDLRESLSILFGAMFQLETRDRGWAFLLEHFDELASRMRDDELTQLVGSAAWLCDEERLGRAMSVFRAKAPKYGVPPRALDNTEERARQCIDWWKRSGPAVEAFLRAAK